ncbi:response regulator transcription factor [Paraflavisolibacter sp. H34]|uniref:response regulator transcription factor n=1 Tax=Huijunlia imazamoxiresistens TaxID=3127457 RepID=UPI0030194005
MERIRVIIADDHALLREGWSFLLNNDPQFQVISVCGSGEEALEQAKAMRPDVVIMDINMPGMSGIDATRLMQQALPQVRVLGVSQHAKPAYAYKMMQEGAYGYLTKTSSKKELFHAIREVHEGRKYVCSEIKDLAFEQSLSETKPPELSEVLTKRELEVVELLVTGQSSKEIAARLNVSDRTVEVHRFNILKKLNLKNTAALVNHVNNSGIWAS